MSSKSKTIATRVAKLTAIGLLGVSIAGGAILFAPATITARLGLHAFGERNRSSIGSVILGAGSLLAACVAVWIWVKLTGMLRERRAAKGPEWCLGELTPEERGYLKPYSSGRCAICVSIRSCSKVPTAGRRRRRSRSRELDRIDRQR